MKSKIAFLLMFLSIKTFANESARNLIIQDLTAYSAQYGIADFTVGAYFGVIDKKYSFEIQYSKSFCDTAQGCEAYHCTGIVALDSDAVVDFEAASDKSQCVLQ